MIQANELRIGNWVNHHGEPVQIKEIYCHDEGGMQSDEYCINHTIIESYEPIPLTTEILAAAGFKHIEEVCGWADRNHLLFECGESGEFWWEFHPFCTEDIDCHLEIKYAHQLQNLIFALTGTELEIDPVPKT